MAKSYNLRDAGIIVKGMSAELRLAAKDGLLSAAHRAVQHIVAVVIPGLEHPPVDRGIYRNAWKAKATQRGAMVYNNSPQAVFIERGVRAANVKPSRAFVAALVEWIRRKGIGSSSTITRGGRQRIHKATEAEATSIAWAIIKTMQSRGIFNKGRGLRVLEKASKQFPRFIKEEVTRELNKHRP